MKVKLDSNQRMAAMTFATVYPLYVAKIESKGRNVNELHHIIEWLTGFNREDITRLIHENVNFEVFFSQAKLNENADKITGGICGCRVEEIENPLTRKIRMLDKIVDELARGKTLDKICRV